MSWLLVVVVLSAGGEAAAQTESTHAGMYECFEARALYLGQHPAMPSAQVLCLHHDGKSDDAKP